MPLHILVFRIYLPPLVQALILSFVGEGAKRLGAVQLYPPVGGALMLSNCEFTDVIENMVRESGLRTPASSLGIWYAIENKDQMRPRLCILTTANHREINACTEKPENGVNGVKSGASLLTPLRYHPEPPLDRLTALFSTATKAIHVTSKCNHQTPT
jgi:hypothetical protein